MHLNVLPRSPGSHAGPAPAIATRPRRPWLAGLLSLLWPGLGQLYNGRFRKGAALLAFAILWRWLGLGAVETFRWWLWSLGGALLLSLYAAWDAFRMARDLREFIPGPRNTIPLYVAAAALLTTATLGAGFVERWAFPIYTVAQTSMRPTLRSGDRLRCAALRPRDIVRRGQLVVFEYPSEHSLIFVKRVVGLPGEVVEVEDGLVYINGDPIDEGFYASRGPGRKSLDMAPARLAPDEYYLMGDNRHASFDSRSFGPVNRARMLATPLYVILSWDDWGRLYLDRTGLPAR